MTSSKSSCNSTFRCRLRSTSMQYRCYFRITRVRACSCRSRIRSIHAIACSRFPTVARRTRFCRRPQASRTRRGLEAFPYRRLAIWPWSDWPDLLRLTEFVSEWSIASSRRGGLAHLLRHQPLARERFLHARTAGLVVLGVLVDVPDVVDTLAGQDVLRREHGGHHRVVLVIVLVHAVATD